MVIAFICYVVLIVSRNFRNERRKCDQVDKIWQFVCRIRFRTFYFINSTKKCIHLLHTSPSLDSTYLHFYGMMISYNINNKTGSLRFDLDVIFLTVMWFFKVTYPTCRSNSWSLKHRKRSVTRQKISERRMQPPSSLKQLKRTFLQAKSDLQKNLCVVLQNGGT